MRVAPVLHDLAGRLSGRPATDARTEPVHWAYALRDAVGLAHPDVLVSHWDPSLEADALTGAMAEGAGDWVDRLLAAPALALAPGTRETVELVKTLAGLYRASPELAASVTGPVSVAAALAGALLGDDPGTDERVELADLCADALAGLIGAYGEEGVSHVVVVEHDGAFLDDAAASEAQAPLVRALAHHRIAGVLIPPVSHDLVAAGYEAVAERWDGSGAPPGVGLLAPDLWALEPDEFEQRWRAIAGEAAGTAALLLSDGPLPAGIPLENLQIVARMA